jgi:PadR family transcriptional regulator, regulatory protein PadR
LRRCGGSGLERVCGSPGCGNPGLLDIPIFSTQDKSVSAEPERITQPLLDVLQALWEASGTALHGHRIKKLTKRSGPTVYNNLDRLAGAGWIVGTWQANPGAGLPARQAYRFTPEGLVAAEEILAKAGRIPCNGGLSPADGGEPI